MTARIIDFATHRAKRLEAGAATRSQSEAVIAHLGAIVNAQNANVEGADATELATRHGILREAHDMVRAGSLEEKYVAGAMDAFFLTCLVRGVEPSVVDAAMAMCGLGEEMAERTRAEHAQLRAIGFGPARDNRRG